MVPSASPVTATSCVVVMGLPIRSRISALVGPISRRSGSGAEGSSELASIPAAG